MSNLLDKSSIVLTASAYDNGKVLCVKPSDGSGDFQFSRNSAATRVNSQGLVEDVQILSSDLVQNGDFSEQGAEEVSNGSFSQQGSQLVTNGDFATDSDWTKEVGWTISGGTANYSGGSSNRNIRQAIGITNGKTYKIQYQVTAITSGEVACRFGGMSGVDEITATTTGTYVGYITANSSVNGELLFEDNDNNFVGSIDNCSVVEVGQNWTFGTGWSVGEDKAVRLVAAPSTDLVQLNRTWNFTSTYKISFNVQATSGAVRIRLGQTNLNYVSQGTHTFYATPSGNQQLKVQADSNFTGSITNISVKEVGQNWTFPNDWEVGNNKIIGLGSGYGVLTQTISLQNKKIKVTFDILDYVSGTFRVPPIYRQDGLDERFSGNGSYEIIYTSLVDVFTFQPQLFDGSVTNISVIEITDDTNLPRINYEGFSYQDALGSEEVVNGDFLNGTNNWQVESSSAIVVGDFKGKTDVAKININNTSTSSRIRQPFNYVNGKTYKVDIEVYVESGNFRSDCSDSFVSGDFVSTSTLGSWQTLTANITAISTGSNYIWLRSISGISEFYISKVSVKEYLGQEVVPDSGCGSWLFEPQTTNLLPYSNDLNAVGWSVSGAITISSNSAISPDGTNNAQGWSNSAAAFPQVGKTLSGLTIGESYTFSFYVKSDGTAQTQLYTRFEGFTRLFFTPTDEWVRITNTIVATATSHLALLGIQDGTAPASSFLLYGFQAEEQSYATSYIPTDGTTVTRNQDVCIGGGSAASINSTEGVLYAEMKTLTETGVFRQINLNDGTTTNRIYISKRADSGGLEFRMDNPLGSLNFSISKNTTNNYVKVAFRYGLNNFAVFIDGVNQNVNPTGNTFSANTFNNLEFTSPINQNFFGKTKALAVWKEALTDTELQELTTI